MSQTEARWQKVADDLDKDGLEYGLKEVNGRNKYLPDHTLIWARSNSWISASKANLKTVQIKRSDSHGSGLTLFLSF